MKIPGVKKPLPHFSVHINNQYIDVLNTVQLNRREIINLSDVPADKCPLVLADTRDGRTVQVAHGEILTMRQLLMVKRFRVIPPQSS